MDGGPRKLAKVLSGVSLGCVFGPLLFLLCTSELFYILKTKLVGYANDSTLMAVVPSAGVRVMVEEALIREFGIVREWYDL